MHLCALVDDPDAAAAAAAAAAAGGDGEGNNLQVLPGFPAYIYIYIEMYSGYRVCRWPYMCVWGVNDFSA